MFIFGRRKKPLSRRAFVWYKVLLAIWTVVFIALLYLIYYRLDLSFLVQLLLGLIMFGLAPALSDLWQSQKDYETDEEEEAKKFFPDDPKEGEE